MTLTFQNAMIYLILRMNQDILAPIKAGEIKAEMTTLSQAEVDSMIEEVLLVAVVATIVKKDTTIGVEIIITTTETIEEAMKSKNLTKTGEIKITTEMMAATKEAEKNTTRITKEQSDIPLTTDQESNKLQTLQSLETSNQKPRIQNHQWHTLATSSTKLTSNNLWNLSNLRVMIHSELDFCTMTKETQEALDLSSLILMRRQKKQLKS